MKTTTTLLTAAVLAATLAACSSASPAAPAPSSAAPTGAASSTPAPATAVDSSDPDAVADAVARTMWAADSRTDTTTSDAAARAVPWLTPTYAEIATQALPGGSGATWLDVVEHDGQIVVTVDDADDIVPDLPPDTTTTATRVRVVTLLPQGRDGWTADPQYLIATLDLTRASTSDPWLVDAITVDEPLTVDEGPQDFG